MKARTTVKAGGLTALNHNAGMKVKSGVKGGEEERGEGLA
jgi:hypothetical protein